MKSQKYAALFFIIFTLPATLTAAITTSKTFFKSSNAPIWLSVNTLPFNQERKPSPTALQSALGVEGFYWKSTAKKNLGNYFGFYDTINEAVCPYLRVTADLNLPHSLTPQDIVHNAAVALTGDPYDTTTNPMQAKITFNPYIEHYGFIMTNSVCINKWITIHTIMPWMQVNHGMGMVITSNTNATVEGNSSSVMDFFTGNLKQEAGNSPNQQDSLQYGKLANKQSISGLADITILCLLSPHVSDDFHAHIGALVVLPTTSRSHGACLFEPTLGSGGHPLFGLHGRAETDFFSLRSIVIGGSIDATLRASVTAQEIRSPSFLLSNNDAAFARYALGGKQNARRLFPLINMLTQVVNVKPGTTIELNIGLNAYYKKVTGNIEYRYTHTGAEKVTPISTWPAATYALSQLSYTQTTVSGSTTTYNVFDLANDSAFTGGGGLSTNAIYFDAAATPTQVTHTFSFAAQCTPLSNYPYSSLQFRGHYSFTGKTLFGVGGYGFNCSLCHTF